MLRELAVSTTVWPTAWLARTSQSAEEGVTMTGSGKSLSRGTPRVMREVRSSDCSAEPWLTTWTWMRFPGVGPMSFLIKLGRHLHHQAWAYQMSIRPVDYGNGLCPHSSPVIRCFRQELKPRPE